MPRPRVPGPGIAAALAAAIALAAELAGAQPSGRWEPLDSDPTRVLNSDTGSFFLTGLIPTVTIDDTVFFGRVAPPVAPTGHVLFDWNPALWRVIPGPEGWQPGFDPYARDPGAAGTLAGANADLLAAWRALVSPLPLVCDGSTGECSVGRPPTSEAQMTWYVLASLVSTSCRGEGDAAERPECFDSEQPFARGRCSFYVPLLCTNARESLVQASLAPLSDLRVDRARIRTRGTRARARLSGRHPSDATALESRDGSFSVVLGGFAESIPLDAFRPRANGLVWRSHGPGLQKVKLYRNGRISLVVRGIESGALDYRALPLLLRVGSDVGTAWIPLE